MNFGDIKEFLDSRTDNTGLSKTVKRKITNACFRFTKTKNGIKL